MDGGVEHHAVQSAGGEGLESRSPLRAVWDWTRSIFVAFVLFLLIRTFAVEAFKIPTGSMENTLRVGDFLLVNKAVYGAEVPGVDLRLPAFDEPERGDVIVFNPPHDPTKNYVKRVVGVPGDVLEMRDKVLYLNGNPQHEAYARYVDGLGDRIHPNMRWQRRYLISTLVASEEYRPSRDTWGPISVPEDRYFVLGDNRDNSEDSRYWGFVSREAIRGRPWVVYYSFDPRGDGVAAWLRNARWNRIGRVIE